MFHKIIKNYINNFIALFYPKLCFACRNTLSNDEEILCIECQYNLPETKFHFEKDNPLSKLFWGKINIETAAALYHYSKNGKIQRLIHNFKYRGNKEIGKYLGNIYGKELLLSPLYQYIDTIIPVPLHKDKEKHRGYSQTEILAKGLSESMKIPVDMTTLFRIKNTETQTNKKRYDRYKNVKDTFVVKHTSHLINKHILLVDDIITSGSTIEASVKALMQIEGIKVSVVAIAFTGI